MSEENSPGPLAGIRVIEIANVIAGPVTCQVLSDFGADVVKVEHPDGGDPSRRQGRPKGDIPLWWKSLGRNKRSIGMYLGDPDAAEIFLKLVATADVVVENFRTGTLEKWNLGYDVLSKVNPKIILARLTGFGQTGPYARKPAFGSNIEAMTGFADLTGEPDRPPMLAVFALADYVAGFSLVGAIMMALYHRDARGGTGQIIDASLFQPLMSALSRQVVHYDQLGFRETRSGNRSSSASPRNAYLTKDEKWVALSVATEKLAARTMVLVGRPDLTKHEWFKTSSGRVSHNDELDGAVAAWIGERTRAEVLAAAEKAEVTMAPIYTIPEMMDDVHVRETDMIPEVDDPDLGKIRMPGVLYRLSKTPGRIRTPAPRLAASTDDILIGELGVDRATVERLRERRVVL